MNDRDLLESMREYEPTVCANCLGMSPTVEQIDQQLAENGDTSGACSWCWNTHVEPGASVR